MATPYLGEIRPVSFGFAPRGWALCNGQLLQITPNQALFSILGSTYGGDGRVTFGLPDLRGRVPVHVGPGMGLGEAGGEASHTLTVAEMPTHSHIPVGVPAPANLPEPAGNLWANQNGGYATTPTVAMDPTGVLPAGGSQSHQNLSPYLVLNFIIALSGIYPSRS